MATQAEKNMVFQILTSIAGYGPNKILSTDSKKQIKWIDIPTIYFSDKDFTGDGTEKAPLGINKQIKLT